jgi:hypothetical protein
MPHTIHRRTVRGLILAGLLAGGAACTDEMLTPPEPIGNPAELYGRLTLNQRAINLSTVAPYDTFRLVATPRTGTGAPLAGAVQVTYTSLDPTRVIVSSTGLVRGLRAATRIRLLVTGNLGQVTHVDTALVTVTTLAAPPVLAAFRLEPNPPDSAKGPMPLAFTTLYYPAPGIVPQAFDTAGNPIANLGVWIESSNSSIATYNNQSRTLTLFRPGPVTFIASTVAYGVARADTLHYTVTLPLHAFFAPIKIQLQLGAPPTYRWSPAATVRLSAGAYVFFRRDPGFPFFDVTFEDPTNVAEDVPNPIGFTCLGAGNIPQVGDSTPIGNFCSRYFPIPGVYRFHSSVLGLDGTIIVE